jgi:hypothetical protein
MISHLIGMNLKDRFCIFVLHKIGLFFFFKKKKIIDVERIFRVE